MLLKELGSLEVRQVLEKPNRRIDEWQKIPLMRLLLDFAVASFWLAIESRCFITVQEYSYAS